MWSTLHLTSSVVKKQIFPQKVLAIPICYPPKKWGNPPQQLLILVPCTHTFATRYPLWPSLWRMAPTCATRDACPTEVRSGSPDALHGWLETFFSPSAAFLLLFSCGAGSYSLSQACTPFLQRHRPLNTCVQCCTTQTDKVILQTACRA